jgi:hypothetical protein
MFGKKLAQKYDLAAESGNLEPESHSRTAHMYKKTAGGLTTSADFQGLQL